MILNFDNYNIWLWKNKFHAMINTQTYKCSICGNIVVKNHDGGGELVCCGKKMNLLNENADDTASTEKHIPVMEKIDNDTYKIKVGSVAHPMTKEHYIEYIEAITDKDERLTYFLKPEDKPEIICETKNKIVSIRAYCNLHGLWVNNF